MSRMIFTGAVLALAIQCGASLAAQQRSFVSTGGSDTNACTLGAPCRSFGAAIAHTLDNGEIVALDSGGYGPVVVNKSVEIVAAPGVHAAITASSGSAIQIVSPASKVAIRGLSINGLGTGQFGIDVQGGSEIVVDRCGIASFAQDGVTSTVSTTLDVRDSDIHDNGNNGISATDGVTTVERTTLTTNAQRGLDVDGAGSVTVRDARIARNGTDGILVGGNLVVTVVGTYLFRNGNFGIHLDATVASTSLVVSVERAAIDGHNTVGIAFNVTGSGATVDLAVSRSEFTENFTALGGGVLGGNYAHVVVTDSVFERNAQAGLSVSGTGTELTISGNTVTGNGEGIAKFTGAAIFTRQDNTVRGNTQDVLNGPLTPFAGT